MVSPGRVTHCKARLSASSAPAVMMIWSIPTDIPRLRYRFAIWRRRSTLPGGRLSTVDQGSRCRALLPRHRANFGQGNCIGLGKADPSGTTSRFRDASSVSKTRSNREARRTCLRPRGSGRHRLSLKFTNVITRTGTCLDETVCLECLIGLQYGGRADLARLGQCANRGQLIACRQRSVADHAADFLRYRPVKLHTQHNTVGADPPLVPASTQDMWRDPSEMITEQYRHE